MCLKVLQNLLDWIRASGPQGAYHGPSRSSICDNLKHQKNALKYFFVRVYSDEAVPATQKFEFVWGETWSTKKRCSEVPFFLECMVRKLYMRDLQNKMCNMSYDMWRIFEYAWQLQFEAEEYNPLDVFPLIPMANKSCNIDRCVNNMLQIIQNMMVSQCSELELSVCRGITLSGQHPLF